MDKTDAAAVKVAAQNWWMFLLQGIIITFLGWLLLTRPISTILNLVLILGIYWVISGVVEIVVALTQITQKGSHWVYSLLIGLLGVVVGLFIVHQPVAAGIITPVMVTYLIAFLFIINGLIEMVVGSKDREVGKYKWSWLSFFLGLLYLIIGLNILWLPLFVSVPTIIFTIALMALVGGIVTIIFSFMLMGKK